MDQATTPRRNNRQMPELNAADDLFEAWIDAQCKRFDQLDAVLEQLKKGKSK